LEKEKEFDEEKKKTLTLYVGNLPENTDVETIRSMFEEHGKVIQVSPLENNGTKLNYTFVEFETREDIEKAFENTQGVQLGEQFLKIDYDIGKEKKAELNVRGKGTPLRFIRGYGRARGYHYRGRGYYNRGRGGYYNRPYRGGYYQRGGSPRGNFYQRGGAYHSPNRGNSYRYEPYPQQ
jgi:RNA recognition motif-containing protein